MTPLPALPAPSFDALLACWVQLRPDAQPNQIRAWMGIAVEGNETRAVIASLSGLSLAAPAIAQENPKISWRLTSSFPKGLDTIFGAAQVEPSIFFIGLQPHTHLEQYGFDQGLIQPGYNPMSMMPWTARQLLWNPEPMGSSFGRICLEAFATNPADFGRTVMALLEREYGLAPLDEALQAPLEGRKALANAVR